MFIRAIKRHIRASSASNLEIEMLRNNLKNNTFYQYDIIFDGKYWYAWFLKEQDVMEAAKEGVKE